MSQPHEILAQPYTAWIAEVGTTFPTIDEEPGGSWTKIGSAGDLNYTEDGVKVSHKQKLNPFRALGSTGVRKVFRTEEDLTVSFAVADMSLEQYSIAMNGNTVTTVPADTGEAGYKSIGLSRGLSVKRYALMLRGREASAYMEDGVSQYNFPVVVQASEPEPNYTKGDPAVLALEFMVLEDPDAASDQERHGWKIEQTTEPGT